jgi:hypothetical protein
MSAIQWTLQVCSHSYTRIESPWHHLTTRITTNNKTVAKEECFYSVIPRDCFLLAVTLNVVMLNVVAPFLAVCSSETKFNQRNIFFKFDFRSLAASPGPCIATPCPTWPRLIATPSWRSRTSWHSTAPHRKTFDASHNLIAEMPQATAHTVIQGSIT